MRVVFYKPSRFYVNNFIKALVEQDRNEVLGCLQSIEDLGFDSPRANFRHIKKKLWEIKINISSGGYRIFYVTLCSDTIVLLHAYKKQSQKAPLKEIAIAEKRLLEVLKHDICYIS